MKKLAQWPRFHSKVDIVSRMDTLRGLLTKLNKGDDEIKLIMSSAQTEDNCKVTLCKFQHCGT